MVRRLGGDTMIRMILAALLLFPAAIPGGDKKETKTLADDWKVLTASAWVNETPDAAWTKLPDGFKKGYGDKGWKRVAVRFYEAPGKPKSSATTHRVDIDFTAVGQDKAFPTWGNLSLTLKEDKGARYFVLKGHADVEYKVEYSLNDGKLTLKGTYYSLNPKIG